MTIGERIHLIRKSHFYKQDDFAKVLGISRTHISKIENNQDNPSEKLIESISALFGVNYDWLKYGKGEMNAENKSNSLAECILHLSQYQKDNTESDNVVMASAIMNTMSFVNTMNRLTKTDSCHLSVDEIFQVLCKLSQYWEKEYTNNCKNPLPYKKGKELNEEIGEITDIYIQKIARLIEVMEIELVVSLDALDEYFDI